MKLDPDGLEVRLRAIKYELPLCCGMCQRGVFAVGSLWGQCDHHKLPIHFNGTCPDRTPDPGKMTILGVSPVWGVLKK